MWPTLEEGDAVGIVALSDPVTERAYLERGLARLREHFDFNIVLGKSAGEAPTPSDKADDLHAFFSDRRIKGIFSARGGDSIEEIFGLIDLETVKKNPKVLMGFSDITPLLNFISLNTPLITFHGPDVAYGLGKFGNPRTLEYLSRRLIEGDRELLFSPPTVLREGKAEGILLGGNIRCFCKIFELDVEFPGEVVLFLESRDEGINEVNCYLSLMEREGLLDRVRALIIGDFKRIRGQDRAALLERLGDFLEVPTLLTEELGHTEVNVPLPVGAKVSVNANRRTPGP